MSGIASLSRALCRGPVRQISRPVSRKMSSAGADPRAEAAAANGKICGVFAVALGFVLVTCLYQSKQTDHIKNAKLYNRTPEKAE
eukprot:CAMPEP_0114539306 /NCGR_PEP_ID=MMETSP0114-20121206/168_1 /TAXON_ID=31324 /ORGANISM="Goniomonas sp, Strain m" /LENGTH=84 /DNA_ID=CAMNT_0001723401 /DNA_START=42 /DNA_END=296 /DNA_ORIENTATION=+